MTVLTFTHEDRVEGLAVLAETRMYVTRGWTQFAFARDLYGEAAPPNSLRATCWCMEGALCAAGGRASPDWSADDSFLRPLWVAEWALEQACGPLTVTESNDRAMSVGEVVGLIDLAQKWLSEETTE